MQLKSSTAVIQCQKIHTQHRGGFENVMVNLRLKVKTRVVQGNGWRTFFSRTPPRPSPWRGGSRFSRINNDFGMYLGVNNSVN